MDISIYTAVILRTAFGDRTPTRILGKLSDDVSIIEHGDVVIATMYDVHRDRTTARVESYTAEIERIEKRMKRSADIRATAVVAGDTKKVAQYDRRMKDLNRERTTNRRRRTQAAKSVAYTDGVIANEIYDRYIATATVLDIYVDDPEPDYYTLDSGDSYETCDSR